MTEFLPPSMPEHDERPASHASARSAEEARAEGSAPTARSELPKPIHLTPDPAPPRRPGALGRLVSLVISVGLAWALVVAITAWLLGLFLARG